MSSNYSDHHQDNVGITTEQSTSADGVNSNFVIPSPPTATVETSSEPPRTLWMGDLDPSFDEVTIQQIWSHLNKKVYVKLIRAKKNLLIPCSSTAGTQSSQQPLSQMQRQQSSVNSTQGDQENVVENNQKININGISFIDPATTPLHHAGYCFVEFETQQDAQFGLSLNSTPLPNFTSQSSGLATNPTGQRNFRLNWASGATLQSSIPSRPEFSLFVGDLSPTATEADLLSLFQQKFKSVKTVRVMTDPITGASRCFGFVRFGDEEERRRALVEMNGVWCQGRCLRVAYATPRNNMMWQVQSAQVQQPTNPASSNSADSSQTPLLVKTANSMIGGAVNQVPQASSVTPIMAARVDNLSVPLYNYNLPQVPAQRVPDFSSSAQAYTTDPNNTTVFIGGLTSKITEDQLQSLFSPFGNILTVKIPQGKNCGFVKFERRIDAEAAIQGLQGFVVAGSPVRLSWGRNTVSTPTNTGNSNGNKSNVLPQFLQQQQQQQQQRQQQILANQGNPYRLGPVSQSSSSFSQPLEAYQNSIMQAQIQAQAQAQVQAQARAQAQAQAQATVAQAQQVWWSGNPSWAPSTTSGNDPYSNGIYRGGPGGTESVETSQQMNIPLMYQQLARVQSVDSQGNLNGRVNFVNEPSNTDSSGISPIPPPTQR